MPSIARKTSRVMLMLANILLLSLSASSSWAQQPAIEDGKIAPPSSGTITGHVVTAGGDALASATIYVSTIGVRLPPRTAGVDGNGSFKIDGLDMGVYSVWANAPGFVTELPNLPDVTRRYYHTGDSVTLALIKGGVITGSVSTTTNAPVVSANVRAFRVRDENGQPVQGLIQVRDRLTDDRGFYRIYGLQPGVYIVAAGGPGQYGWPNLSAYDNDAPTYAPSSTRDTATEIIVRSGEETTVDIQYRGEPGHVISGALTGFSPSTSQIQSGGSITLTELRTRAMMNTPASSFTNYTFAFYGVADGEYELLGQQFSQSGETRISEPRRIKIQGEDLTGVNLTLAPLASIAGRIVLESSPPADCVKRRTTALQETVIAARRIIQETKAVAAKTAKDQPVPELPLAYVNQNVDAVADVKGAFNLRNLHAGSYRIAPQLPSGGWYVRSIAIGSAPKDTNVPRDGVTVKSGERVSGLTVTVTEGAASLRGRVSVGEGQRLPRDLRVYLLPAERENLENVLRFFEARAESDGSFAIGNIAPGRYWLFGRAGDESDPTKVKAIRQDSALRSQILKEAEGAKIEITLQPCQRMLDYDLRYPPAPAEAKPNQ